MKHGDFTELAKYYVNRPGYSNILLECLKDHIFNCVGEGMVADIGAGTGKLTEQLADLGLRGFAVEPNDAMRNKGKECFQNRTEFVWQEGAAEKSNLNENSMHWALMGSSFHWTNSEQAVKEFYRILVPGGFFTAIWNPRDIESSELHQKIEDVVYSELPNMKRVSSGRNFTMEDMRDKLLSGGFFKDILFMEAPHVEVMSKERYMNIWKSVNDIQVQAGPERFQKILNKIEEIIQDMDEIEVPYRSRAWTVQSTK